MMSLTDHHYPDGTRRVTVDRWDERALFDQSWLLNTDREYVQPDEGGVRLRVSNGFAYYRFVGVKGSTFEGVLMEHSWNTPGTPP